MSDTEERLPAYPSPKAKTEVVESDDRRGAWIRSHPNGNVHYFPDCTAHNQASCGQRLRFWPDMDWPEGEFCPDCKEIIVTALER